MMKKLMAKNLCLQFSLTGKFAKKAFDKTNLFQVIIDALRQRFESATEYEVNKTIGRWLATARDREGGRTERNSQTQQPTSS
ncbi:hypothetical protein QE152_g9412 [Popillia japonica]|uniref:DUF4806 domain-containing protein n=1 Tax=Popillia japonica TaxID=7064 RepID=A0AAW1LZ48_POPJA